ncbi:MAG: molybdopterin molybdotransferase MoeA [Campylobacterota bacterium]
MSLNEAIDLISNINISNRYEIIPIENASNRVCAQDIYATSNLPKFNNSAMDGYAVLDVDINDELDIQQIVFAGDTKPENIKNNHAIKIMTGAIAPTNTKAIIPKEDIIKLNDKKIKIQKNTKKFQHIRFEGEDIKEGNLLIKNSEVLEYSKITLLASQGISYIKVYKKPKVVVFASGEELKLHYEYAQSHQIYNSNTPTYLARAKELGCDTVFIGQAKDNINSLKDLIKNSLDADLIITSGGVSVGDADFTKEAFEQLNFETIIDTIAIKPGKPTIFGKIDNTYVLNLPGNPLASALIFEVFGKLIIQKLLGNKDIYYNYIETKLSHDFENKKGRVTILPGYFDGEAFTISQNRSPGMVSTLSSCNAITIFDSEVTKLDKDTKIKVLPIKWNFFTNIKKDFITYE